MAPVSRDPKPGDLIEICRLGYQHWAIYIGDGYVVHLAPPSEYAAAGSSSLMSVLSNRALVKRDLLEDVVGGCPWSVKNKYDDQYSPQTAAKIVRMAEECVGHEMSYALTSANCEHFVTKLRYGVKISEQVDNAITTVSWAAVGFAALGLAGFMYNRHKRQNQ